MTIESTFCLPRDVRGKIASALVVSLALVASACVKPEPRRFEEFMDDRIAREGTLARCNQNRDDTAHDIECANARRAASAVALMQERERSAELERESERKLSALRSQLERRDRAKRDAMQAALAAAEAAYEAQWAEWDEESTLDPTFESRADLDAAPVSEARPPAVQQFGAPIAAPAVRQGEATQESAPAPTIPRPFQ